MGGHHGDGADVALLAEGVDRNKKSYTDYYNEYAVALLAEGVDRNSICQEFFETFLRSPSSRRAWIEIPLPLRKCRCVRRRPPRGGRG